MSFTNVFTGSTIYPAEVSLTKLALTGNISLYWPLEADVGQPLASRIVQIDSATSSNLVIRLPDAMLASVGETILFNNLSIYSVIVSDYNGTQSVTVDPATEWQVYLATNTTQAGVWKAYQFGATTSNANASLLAGNGLKANGSELETAFAQTNVNVNTTIVNDDRAKFLNWTGNLGTFTLPVAATVGNNWYIGVRNSGLGNLTLDPPGLETINGTSSLQLSPGDSATVITDGINFFTLGLGQNATFAFDYIVVDVSGSTDYVLAGSELNRIAYQFIGTLGADISVIVPQTTQQYWVYDNTTGGFDLSIATATQVTPLALQNTTRTITYCDGTDVVPAVTAFIVGTISGGVF